MKKIIGIALVLAVALTALLSIVALADDPPPPPGVQTTWDWQGVGSITIDNAKNGGAEGSSHLYVETSGSSSSGFENVSTSPHGYPWCGTDFRVERYVEFGDGIIDGNFTRANTYQYWPAHTEYGAHLESDGEGFFYQNYYNTYYYAGFHTTIQTDCSFSMGAWEQGSIGGDWFFGMGAGSDDEYGFGMLDVNFTDRSEHNGTRLMYGGFYTYADPAASGFDTSWSQLAQFGGLLQTPSLDQNFNVGITGPGNYGKGGNDAWVIISGFINGLK